MIGPANRKTTLNYIGWFEHKIFYFDNVNY